ncbi:MAG: hypothetical protein UX38_C0003G0025 [Microgenomates group bacterium GW2011_GWC1_46_16]|nr:MAG: hypothetical protein UX38_C0003G0025 [Microgenomates group bacterium GW2011_GWC1_46_16]KKU44229.1 MAG: hypothetical protein UX59_C0002G0015 [Microgenomates group bacterium GW2011_GWA1_46_7]KKU61331.1 MAG: hypothetical protein UX84_C0019G0004 [Microgenomates group bacterium GW2011_GWD1_47_13]
MFDLFQIEGVTFEVSAVVDGTDFGFALEAALPGRDQGSGSNHFAGGVNRANQGKEMIGNSVGGRVGHRLINALFAVISKELTS